MNEYKIIKEVILGKSHEVTGKTKHFRGGDRVINIATLKVVAFPNDLGFYLLYFDKDGNELTDTYHDSIEQALEQAKWEFLVKPEEWKSPEGQ